jgi:hypothetical protein
VRFSGAGVIRVTQRQFTIGTRGSGVPAGLMLVGGGLDCEVEFIAVRFDVRPRRCAQR